MFAGWIVATCLVSGDGVAAPKTPTSNAKFDVRRAVQWLFGKRAPSTKDVGQMQGSSSIVESTDSHLELKCRANVFSDPALRATGMTVKVVGGVAYLEGAVASRFHRLRAEQLAQRTPGVNRVENQLRVGEDEVAARPSIETQTPVSGSNETNIQTIAAPTGSPSVVVSRPKSLPTDASEPVVTTYTIRRSGDKHAELHNAAGTEKTPIAKRNNVGKLVPWNDSASTRSSWLETLGVVKAAEPSTAKDVKSAATPSLDPLDVAVQRVLSAHPEGDQLTFERIGDSVVLKGSAPAAAKLKIARELGGIPGVGTVVLDPSGVGRQ